MARGTLVRLSPEGPMPARLTVDQYHRLLEAGILRECEQIELIDGVLVLKDRSARGESATTIGKRHATAVKLLFGLVSTLASRGFHIQIQQPLTIPPDDELEPDGAIVRGVPRDYLDHHPGAGDISCVIEVADSSLVEDRTVKLRTYAAAGIPQYVIVSLIDDFVESYCDPRPGDAAYARTETPRRGETLSIDIDGGAHVQVAVADLLP